MTTKVARITFPDGAVMYTTYSTVSDSISDAEIISVPEKQRQWIEHPETNPNGQCSTEVLAAVRKSVLPIGRQQADVPEEPVTCEILHYCKTIWSSTARRNGVAGKLTGFMSEEAHTEYCEAEETRAAHAVRQQATIEMSENTRIGQAWNRFISHFTSHLK